MYSDDTGTQLRGQIDSGPGDVLVNPEQFFAPVEDIVTDGFTVRRFIDLCGTIEACVLNERLLMVATRAQTARLMDGSTLANDIMTEPFFLGLAIQASPEDVMAQFNRIQSRIAATTSKFSAWMNPHDLEDRARVSADLALTEGVFWEETLQIPYLPTPQQAANFVSAQEFPYRHWLYLEYGEVRSRALTARLREEYGPQALPVPPIALTVLQRSESIEDIGVQLLLQRDKLSRLREITRTLDESTRDRHASAAQKRRRRLSYEKHWRREVEKAIGDDQAEALIAMPATTSRAEEVARLVGSAAASGHHPAVKGIGAAVKVAPKAIDWLRGAPFRQLGSAMRRSFKLAPAAIDREVCRLFGHEITEADRELAHQLTNQLPKALANNMLTVGARRRQERL